MAKHVLTIRNLTVTSSGGAVVLNDVSLDVREGEVVALIGASGSGKTTLALSALGRLRPGLSVRNGQVRLGETDVLTLSPHELRSVRGRKVAYVAQSSAAAFNPRMRLIDQVVEASRLRSNLPRAELLNRAMETFRTVRLPRPEVVGRRFPHQVSGGQLQRFMIAMGLQEEPSLLVCDEPTSALDVTTQFEVLRLLKEVITARNTAALFVSHDLPVVAQIATMIAVMQNGRVVEFGTTEDVLYRPVHPYTKELIAACRELSLESPASLSKDHMAGPSEPNPRALLKVDIKSAGYGGATATSMGLKTLQDAHFGLERGKIVAVIGESGSGKTTLARVIAGLHRGHSSGSVFLDGKLLAPTDRERSLEDRRKLQMVFQMADTALNPRQTVRRILGRTLRFFHGLRGADAEAKSVDLLKMVQLPAHYLDRLSTKLSGGEKQRVNLARALAADPDVLLCDEITSALDPIVARSIIALIDNLRREVGLSVVFISHDLATVADLADHVIILRHGRIVESGGTRDVLSKQSAPYTRLLVNSTPQMIPGWLDEVSEAREQAIRSLSEPAGQ